MDPFDDRKDQRPDQARGRAGTPPPMPLDPGLLRPVESPVDKGLLPPPPPMFGVPPPPPPVEGPFGPDLFPTARTENHTAELVNRFFDKRRKNIQAAHRRSETWVEATRIQTATAPLDLSKDRFPGPAAGQPEIEAAKADLDARGDGDNLKRMLGHFPFYGRGQALVIREEELPDPISLSMGRTQALEILEQMDLITEAGQGWELTQRGAGVFTRLRDSDVMADHVLDAQMATLSSRMFYDAAAAGPFLEAAGHLLRKSLRIVEEGHPTWWGTAVRAIHNAVVMDLDRPGNLLPNGGGVTPQAFQAMVNAARQSPLAVGGPEADFLALLASLEARETIRDQVKAVGGDRLNEIMLRAETYGKLREDTLGLRAMAHVAWVHLTRETPPEEPRMDMAVALARAVTGLERHRPFHSADLALITPDHREHVLLAALYQDHGSPDTIAIAATPEEARRRLAGLYGPIDREYPAVGTKIAAAVRILQLHDCYQDTPEPMLDRIARKVFMDVEDAREFGDELTMLAQTVLGQPLSSRAVSDLIRGQMLADLERPLLEVPEAMAAGEWIAVQERFTNFQSMEEANLYRFALMEYLERERDQMDNLQKGILLRMLSHATTIMAVLGQQDQVRHLPDAEKAALGEFSTEELQELIEGDGGRFGVARVPWLETERETQWHRMVEVMNLRVHFPEDLNRVTGALMQILGTHVAPGFSGEAQEVGQRQIAQAHGIPLGVIEGLDSRETSEILAYVQTTALAQKRGILCYHGEGVTVSEAIKIHQELMSK